MNFYNGPLVINHLQQESLSHYSIIHDIYPWPALSIGLEHSRAETFFYWYVLELPEYKMRPNAAVRKETEEDLCHGIPALELSICKNSGMLAGIELQLRHGMLHEDDPVALPIVQDFHASVFDKSLWDIRKDHVTKIRACRAPLKIQLQDDFLIVRWFLGEHVDWVAVNDSLFLAFSLRQELVGFGVAGVDVGAIQRINELY